MIKDFENSVVFSDTSEFDDKSPMQNVLLDIIQNVNRRIIQFYLTPESRNYDIKPPEMLVMVTANIFANLAHAIMNPIDTGTKINVFNRMNNDLYDLSEKLFMTLETHFSADVKKVN